MKTLSKRIVVIGSLCCLIVLSLLFLWSRNNKKTLTEEFKIADFYDKETKSFQFRDISFGIDMETVEKKAKITFPAIPYFCEEWAAGILPSHPEQLRDYRNLKEYDTDIGAEFLAYRDAVPVLIEYDQYRGHLTYTFDDGKYSTLAIYFGTAPSVRDPKMNYGGVINDIDQLYADLSIKTDEYLSQFPEVKKKESKSEDYQSWVCETEDSEGYQTRLFIQRERDDHNPEDGRITFAIYRLRFKDGRWTTK